MTHGIVSCHGTRILKPEANAEVLSSTAHELVFRRALGGGQESSTTTSSSNGLLGSQTLFPSSTSSPNSGGRHGISQMALEWFFAVIALGLLTIIVIWRCTYVRYRNRILRTTILPSSLGQGNRPFPRPLSYAHSLRTPHPAHIRDSEDLTTGSRFNRQTRALVLSPSFLHSGLMPLVDGRGVLINTPNVTQPRVRGHRVRGLDVDERGRRGGGGEDEDEDGVSGPAEELPAYETGKGPPGYQVAIGNTARPDVLEVELLERIEEYNLQHLEESQNIDPSSPRLDYTSSSLDSHPQICGPRSPPSTLPEPTFQGHPSPHSCEP